VRPKTGRTGQPLRRVLLPTAPDLARTDGTELGLRTTGLNRNDDTGPGRDRARAVALGRGTEASALAWLEVATVGYMLGLV